jgi:hypothetical protein
MLPINERLSTHWWGSLGDCDPEQYAKPSSPAFQSFGPGAARRQDCAGPQTGPAEECQGHRRQRANCDGATAPGRLRGLSRFEVSGPPPGALWASANRRSFSRQTSTGSSSTSVERANSQPKQPVGTRTGSSSKGPVRDRGQGRPLGADAPARQAAGAQAGAALLPGGLSCGATPKGATRCTLTSARCPCTRWCR